MGKYDTRFYNTIRSGTQASAGVVVPLVCELVSPETMIDIGCGEGWWAQAFADCGVDATGVDGSYVSSSPLGDRFIAHDLSTPLPVLGTYDLAMSLEVAEHLPPHRATSFVADLCRLAPVVLFSAAVPGQGGTGHVNEQWPSYWVEKFQSHGYRVTGALRWTLWEDDRVENWYRQNLMLAVAEDHWCSDALTELLESPLSPMWPVVHPVLFDHVRGA